MSAQTDQIKAALEAANSALDNISSDVADLKAKLEESGVPQELIDQAAAIQAKAEQIAALWQTEPEQPQDGE